MNKALIACGGTGGHLSPGIALAEEMISRGWQCQLLVSTKQVDSRLLRKYSNLDYETIPGSGLSLHPVRFAQFVYNLAAGFARCFAIIRESKPQVVIGFGGFLSAAALFAGYVCRARTAIHEANRVPGRVTRVTSWFVDAFYLPPGIFLPRRSGRTRHARMPVRREIVSMPRSKAKIKLGLDPQLKLLVVVGGSQGATVLNNWVKQNLDALVQVEVQSYCLGGRSVGSRSEITYRSRRGSEVKSVLVSFCDEMGTLLSAADLVVSRAGAGSISEFIRCRAPSILVPFPHASDNHQRRNAEHLEQQGAAIVLDQDYLDSLFDEVTDLIYNDWLLQRLRTNLAKLQRDNPQAIIAADLERLVAGSDERTNFPAAARERSAR